VKRFGVNMLRHRSARWDEGSLIQRVRRLVSAVRECRRPALQQREPHKMPLVSR